MKLERKNLTTAVDTNTVLSELERTMIASIALMKRLRRERRRSIPIAPTTEEQTAWSPRFCLNTENVARLAVSHQEGLAETSMREPRRLTGFVMGGVPKRVRYSVGHTPVWRLNRSRKKITSS